MLGFKVCSIEDKSFLVGGAGDGDFLATSKDKRSAGFIAATVDGAGEGDFFVANMDDKTGAGDEDFFTACKSFPLLDFAVAAVAFEAGLVAAVVAAVGGLEARRAAIFEFDNAWLRISDVETCVTAGDFSLGCCEVFRVAREEAEDVGLGRIGTGVVVELEVAADDVTAGTRTSPPCVVALSENRVVLTPLLFTGDEAAAGATVVGGVCTDLLASLVASGRFSATTTDSVFAFASPTPPTTSVVDFSLCSEISRAGIFTGGADSVVVVVADFRFGILKLDRDFLLPLASPGKLTGFAFSGFFFFPRGSGAECGWISCGPFLLSLLFLEDVDCFNSGVVLCTKLELMAAYLADFV